MGNFAETPYKQIKPNNMTAQQKITPCLWVEKDAKEAANYYLSIFRDGKLKDYRQFTNPPEMGGANFDTAVMEIAGVEFSILAAGPLFKFNEAVSFVVNCKNQNEVDYYWNKLTSDGGTESRCGWLKDKFGVSWQIIPTRLIELLTDPDPIRSQKVMMCMLQMKKIIISDLENAYKK